MDSTTFDRLSRVFVFSQFSVTAATIHAIWKFPEILNVHIYLSSQHGFAVLLLDFGSLIVFLNCVNTIFFLDIPITPVSRAEAQLG